MNDTAIPTPQAGVISQQAHGRTVLLRLDDGGYYAVDEVGAFIWDCCDGHRTVDDVVQAVLTEFDAPADAVSADVRSFLRDLQSENLLALPA